MSAYINGTPTLTETTLPPAIAIKVENDTENVQKCVLVTPTQLIKSEPPLDIDDSCNNNTVVATSFSGNDALLLMNEALPENPKIRLKPACKLMPCPNPTDPKRRFKCPFEHCTKAYGKSSHLRSHLTWHTGVKPFVCNHNNCGRGFTRSDELNRHIRTHTGEKPFECMQCTKKFSRSDHLTKHLATHAKQTNNNNNNNKRAQQQQQQQAQGTQEQRLQQLQQQQQQRRQQQQQRQQQYQQLSQQHQMQKRLEEQQQQQKRLEEQQQQQQQQPAQLITNNNNNNAADNNHLQFSDGMHFMAALISGNDGLVDSEMDAVTTDDVKLKIKEERPEPSDEYPMVTPAAAHPHHQHHQQQLQRQYQQNERMNEAADDGDIPPELIMPVSTMICPPSPVATRPHDPQDDQIMPEANAIIPFRQTPKIGTGLLDPERPFPCMHCEKSFKRQDDLNRHVRTHTGEKPFACGECSRRFMRGDHLKKHMRTHTRVR